MGCSQRTQEGERETLEACPSVLRTKIWDWPLFVYVEGCLCVGVCVCVNSGKRTWVNSGGVGFRATEGDFKI